LSPRVGIKVLIDLLLVLCPENEEYFGGSFERSGKARYSGCLQLVYEDTVSFPLRLSFERFLRIVGWAILANQRRGFAAVHCWPVPPSLQLRAHHIWRCGAVSEGGLRADAREAKGMNE
jgi:hypothetical protein